jgi:hypothetical protein
MQTTSSTTSSKLGTPKTVRFGGHDAEFRPILGDNGKPIQYPVSMQDRGMFFPVFGMLEWGGEDGHPRAVVMSVYRETAADIDQHTRNDGHPNRRFLQLYRAPASRTVDGREIDWSVREIPIVDGPEESDRGQSRMSDGQTISYKGYDPVRQRMVDIYLSKPGWRYATEQDVRDCITRAAANDVAHRETTRLKDPRVMLGETMKQMAGQFASGQSATMEASIDTLAQAISKALRGEKPAEEKKK